MKWYWNNHQSHKKVYLKLLPEPRIFWYLSVFQTWKSLAGFHALLPSYAETCRTWRRHCGTLVAAHPSWAPTSCNMYGYNSSYRGCNPSSLIKTSYRGCINAWMCVHMSLYACLTTHAWINICIAGMNLWYLRINVGKYECVYEISRASTSFPCSSFSGL